MDKLKGIMRENRVSQENLAKMLGITVQTLNAKLNGRSSFTVEEASSICEIFKIDDPKGIFFTSNVPNTQQVRR